MFIDASVDPQSKVGFGAYLCTNQLSNSQRPSSTVNTLEHDIRLKRFDDTSSTQLELQALLWALANIDKSIENIVLYTDCQNLLSLKKRREKLEKTNFTSKNNTRLSNAVLYQKFFSMTDQFNCELVKVEGHKPSRIKNEVDQLFSLVDNAARKALRKYKKSIRLNLKETQHVGLE